MLLKKQMKLEPTSKKILHLPYLFLSSDLPYLFCLFFSWELGPLINAIVQTIQTERKKRGKWEKIQPFQEGPGPHAFSFLNPGHSI